MKDWIVETRVTSRRIYLVQADDEKEAIFATTQVPPEVDEDEFEETMSVSENPSGSTIRPLPDSSCSRCGAAPRNASGLCAACLDEDAERAGEIQSQSLWRQALDAEQVSANQNPNTPSTVKELPHG